MEAQGSQGLEREALGRGGPSTGSEPAAPLQSHLQPLALALKQNLPQEARRSTWSRNEAWFGGAGLGQPSPSLSRPTSAVKAKVKAKVREATGRLRLLFSSVL